MRRRDPSSFPRTRKPRITFELKNARVCGHKVAWRQRDPNVARRPRADILGPTWSHHLMRRT